MRNQRVASLAILLVFFIVGCRGNIELVGYGVHPGIQHGLKVELLSNGSNGALISIQNTSDNIISVNQSSLAMVVSVKMRKGDEFVSVQPYEHIKVHMRTSPEPDDFIHARRRISPFPFHTKRTGTAHSIRSIGSRKVICTRLRCDLNHILDHSPRRLQAKRWAISKYRTIYTNHWP